MSGSRPRKPSMFEPPYFSGSKRNDFEIKPRSFDDFQPRSFDSEPADVSQIVNKPTAPIESQEEKEKRLDTYKSERRNARMSNQLWTKSFDEDLDKQLEVACRKNDYYKAKQLIESGANANLELTENSALDEAIKTGNEEFVYELIRHADANFNFSKAFQRDEKMKAQMLNIAIDDYVTTRNEEDRKFLLYLIQNLLSLKADPNIKSSSYPNSLTNAIKAKDLSLIHLLVEHGAKVKAQAFAEIEALATQDNDVFLKIKALVKAPLRGRKDEILKTGSFQSGLFTQEIPKPLPPDIQAIAIDPVQYIDSQLYVETNNRTQILSGLAKLHMNDNHILKPLINLVALAANGQRHDKANHKPFKTIITGDIHVGSVAIGGELGTGIYTKKNSVFVGTPYLFTMSKVTKEPGEADMENNNLYVYEKSSALYFKIKDSKGTIYHGEFDPKQIPASVIALLQDLGYRSLSFDQSRSLKDDQDEPILIPLFDFLKAQGFQPEINHRLQLAIIVHEWKHFSEKELFGDPGVTYSSEDAQLFAEVFDKTQQRISLIKPQNELEQIIHASFLSVFNEYHFSIQPAELLARVPEVLGLLGIEDGYNWLKENTPELLEFYEKHYNNYIANYLEEKNKELQMTSSDFGPK